MTLRFRITLSFLTVAALGAALSFALVRCSSESLFRSFVFSGDSAKANAYALMLADHYRAGRSWDDAQRFIGETQNSLSALVSEGARGGHGQTGHDASAQTALGDLLTDRVVVVDARGVIVADTADELIGTVHPWKHISHGVPVMADGERAGTVLVGSMIDSTLTGVSERYLSDVTRSLAVSTALAALLALLLGVLLASRVTKPLAGLARAAKSLAGGIEPLPIPETGNDEIAVLSRSFNEMASEIRRLDEAKRRVIADSAHELRTPVTLIRGMIEGMIDGVYPLDEATLKSVHEETIRLSRLIDTLRELEVIESGGLRLDMESVSLRDMTEQAMTLFAASAREKSISLVSERGDGIAYEARGDRFRLEEVLYNVLANALRYTPAGGTVMVRELNDDASMVGFAVGDSGPGIPVDERARVLERFYRIDKSRSSESGGRGLGLAIASEIVKAHGGAIEIGESSLGGALVTVLIPRG